MTRPNNQGEDEQSTSSASPNEGATHVLRSPATSASDTKYTQTTSQLRDQPGPSGVRRKAGSSASPNQGATSTSSAPRPNINRLERDDVRISQSYEQPGPSGVRRNAGASASPNQDDTKCTQTTSQLRDQPGPSGVRRNAGASASSNQGATSTSSTLRPNLSRVKKENLPISQSRDQPGPSGVRRNVDSFTSPNQGATSTSSTPRPNINRVQRGDIQISQSFEQPGPSGVRRKAGASASPNQSTASTLSTLRSMDMNETEIIQISQSCDQPGPSGVRTAMSSAQFQNQAAAYVPSRGRRTTERYPAVPTNLIDCRYYRENKCNRGNYCRFRHQPASRETQEICQDFIQRRCLDVRCRLRHDENDKNLGEILCKIEKDNIGSCSKVGCPFYHRDLNSFANQAKALFFIRHPLTVEVDGPPLQQFPHDAYRGSCFWEHIPGGCRRENCTFIHENGPFSLNMRRYLLLQIVPRNCRQPAYDSTVQMWHNSLSHIYSVEQWVMNVSAGHYIGRMVGFPSSDTMTTWVSYCPSSIFEHPPLNWPPHYIKWEWVVGAAAAHWTPEFRQQIDPEWESAAGDEQWESASDQQSPPRQINPQLESLRWPPMEINPEWSTSVIWTTASVQASRLRPQQFHPQISPQQIYLQRPPQQIYRQRPPQQIFPQRPPHQIYLQRPQQQIYPQRLPQQIYPQRLPQQIYPQRPPQQIYPQRPPHQTYPQRPPQQIYLQRPPQEIYPQRSPQQIHPQRPPQQFHPQRTPQELYPQRPPQQFYPQRPPQQFYPQRPPQQFYPQMPPQNIYLQRPPQQINPQWPPQQFNPQSSPQPINPQLPAGAVNAQWSSVYMQQSSGWLPQPIYLQQPAQQFNPQQPPQQINAQWSWGLQQNAMAASWQTAQYSYYVGPWSQNMLLRAPVRPNVYFSPYANTGGYFVDSRRNYAGVPYPYTYPYHR